MIWLLDRELSPLMLHLDGASNTIPSTDGWRSLLHEMTQWRIDFENTLEQANANKHVVVWRHYRAEAWRDGYARTTLRRLYGEPLRLWVAQTVVDGNFSDILRSLCHDMVACLIQDEVVHARRLAEFFTAAEDDQATLTLRFG